jgi:hypothetical protein
MDQVDVLALDQGGQVPDVAADAERALGLERQGHVGSAGALDLMHHAAAGRGHDRAPAGLDQCLGDLDRAALDPAGDERRQHLQHGRRPARRGAWDVGRGGAKVGAHGVSLMERGK